MTDKRLSSGGFGGTLTCLKLLPCNKATWFPQPRFHISNYEARPFSRFGQKSCPQVQLRPAIPLILTYSLLLCQLFNNNTGFKESRITCWFPENKSVCFQGQGYFLKEFRFKIKFLYIQKKLSTFIDEECI